MTTQSEQLNELFTTIEQAVTLTRDFTSRAAAEKQRFHDLAEEATQAYKAQADAENHVFSERVTRGLSEMAGQEESLMRRHAEARAHLETVLTTLEVRFEDQKRQHLDELAGVEADRQRIGELVSERIARFDDEAHGLVRRFDETRQHLEKHLLAELQGRMMGEYRSTVERLEDELERLRGQSRQELQRLDDESHALLRRQTETMHHVEETLAIRLTDMLGKRLTEELAARHAELRVSLDTRCTEMDTQLTERCTEIGHRLGESLQGEVDRARDRLAAFQEEVLRQVSAELETERQHARDTLAALERSTREAESRLDATRAATDELGRELDRRMQWFDAHMARPWYERLFNVIRGRRYPAMG